MSSRGKDKYEHKVFNGSVDSRVQESRNETFKKRLPLRVQNDWSEHISSKGLIYYYNCRTEVSQWQKPEEWTLSSMPQDDVKKLISTKSRNGENNNKRNHANILIPEASISPKRIKYNNINQIVQIEKPINNNIPNLPKSQKNELNRNIKLVNPSTNTFSGINKCKNNEANFNNDDMDISPGSSPLSRGSHSSDCDIKKHNYFEFETPTYSNSKPQKIYSKSWNTEQKVDNSSPAIHESSISNQPKVIHNKATVRLNSNTNINKYPESSSNSASLTQFQISLAMSLRSTLNVLQPRSQFASKEDLSNSKIDNCLSVYHISDLLFRLEAVNNNGETVNSYRSHRLQAQLSQSNNSCQYSNNNNNEQKSAVKPPANIIQIKEIVKCLQDFIQENYPNSLSTITPVSPNYSKSNRITYYLQILTNLIETCLIQLCPQSFNSPSSTSSPGSLKDNNSSVSTSGTSQSYVEIISKPDIDSPTKKEHIEIEKPKSILQDTDMVKYVSTDVTNSYRNQLADYYVQEAQVEYYKFVRLHSVLYAELACESKKLKALVRISEINTELLKQKKEDLEKLVQMLESRRLPNHLKCDYIPNS